MVVTVAEEEAGCGGLVTAAVAITTRITPFVYHINDKEQSGKEEENEGWKGYQNIIIIHSKLFSINPMSTKSVPPGRSLPVLGLTHAVFYMSSYPIQPLLHIYIVHYPHIIW